MGDMYNRLKNIRCSCEVGSPNDQCPIHGYEAWKKQVKETYKQERDREKEDDMIPADEAGEASANQEHRWG